jgi:programmed cell death protein 5
MEGMSVEQLMRLEKLKKEILRKALSPEARERLGRVRLVKPQLAAQVELYLIQLYQAGRLGKQVTDEQLKSILKSISSRKKFRIVRR